MTEVKQHSTAQYKEIKTIQTKKEEIKLYLFPDRITVYIESSEEATKKKSVNTATSQHTRLIVDKCGPLSHIPPENNQNLK